MDIDDYDFDQGPEPEEARTRDLKIDDAKAALMKTLFNAEPQEVFYETQIQIIYEEQYFHWITSKALKELADGLHVRSEVVLLEDNTPVRFYWSRKNRYYSRKQHQIQELIKEHAHVAQATGRHGETMFDAALPKEGFLPTARNVREYKGRAWTQSGHNLDRVFERDGIAYGTEIKNTMAYIPLHELRLKLDLCDHLHLRPLFILRFAPKSYIERVRGRGGFTLLYKYQMLPHGFEDLAKRLCSRLRLPVDSPTQVSDGTIKRLLKWHLRHIHATATKP